MPKEAPAPGYSVAILIIDALSQQNFVRSLPLTRAYLDQHGGLLFTGYHKVMIVAGLCIMHVSMLATPRPLEITSLVV